MNTTGTIWWTTFVLLASIYGTHSDIERECQKDHEFTLFFGFGETIQCDIATPQQGDK